MSLDQHLTKLGESLEGSVKVGFMAGATYPDGTPVAAVAFWNEYGASGPPRPFFRNMIANESGDWGDKLATQLQLGKSGDDALSILGTDIAGALEQSIIDLVDPPLAESTIERKGFDKPLIDTAHMKNSITWILED
jgi:hypothetical protein